MKKPTNGGGSLRLVTGAEKDPRPPLGPRLRELRVALKLTAGEVCRRSAEAAARLGGPPYEPISAPLLSHIESEEARNKLLKDAPRAVLCVIFDLSRDEFADYLDGRASLEQTLAARDARRQGAPASWRRREVTFGDAPNWPGLVEEARKLAGGQLTPVDLSDETFAELREVVWIYGPPTAIDATTVAQWAMAIQSTRRRLGPGAK